MLRGDEESRLAALDVNEEDAQFATGIGRSRLACSLTQTEASRCEQTKSHRPEKTQNRGRSKAETAASHRGGPLKLANRKSDGRNDQTGGPEAHAHIPVAPLAREQGNGGDDQADLQQRFAQIKTICAPFCLAHLRLLLAGGLLCLGQFLIPSLEVAFIAVENFVRRRLVAQ